MYAYAYVDVDVYVDAVLARGAGLGHAIDHAVQ